MNLFECRVRNRAVYHCVTSVPLPALASLISSVQDRLSDGSTAFIIFTGSVLTTGRLVCQPALSAHPTY